MGQWKKQNTPSIMLLTLFSENYNYDGDYTIDTKVLLVQFNTQNINFSKIEPLKKSVLENYNPDCINCLIL